MSDPRTAFRFEDVPRDDLFRGLVGHPLELRADGGATGTTLHGHFTTFDDWSEIDSWWEGRFMERTVEGAFKKTIKEQFDRIRVQFDHGYDSFVGSAPLGPIDILREEPKGPYYEVPLLDTDYNRDRMLPMLRGQLMDGTHSGSVLGASYRFRVTKEDWVEPSKSSAHNPEKLPERTIREVLLYEFGPVVFPAFPNATAGVRSLTDHYRARQLARTGQAARAAQHLALIAGSAAPSTEPASPKPPQALEEANRTSAVLAVQRARMLLTSP